MADPGGTRNARLILWRISRFADLSGRGGEIGPGRWHEAAIPIVYLADSSALAMLEVLVNLETDEIPATFQLIRVEAPDDLRTVRYEATSPPPLDRSRSWGEAWLRERRTAIADVPSAVAPYGRNRLLNPLHADAKAVRIAEKSRWPWDNRLFR